jgi:glycosyltransferase involved in cell wall biosynthesis
MTARRTAPNAGARVLRIPDNRGYCAALQAGYKLAHEERADVVVQLDADGQHDPVSIKTLLAALEDPEVEVVVGSRFLTHRRYKIPPAKRLGMALFRSMLWILTRRRFTDPTSGFQAIRKSALPYFTSEHFPMDYPDANVIYFLWKAGIKVVEAPAVFHPSPPGKAPLHRGLRAFTYMMKMSFSLLRIMISPIPKELVNSGKK